MGYKKLVLALSSPQMLVADCFFNAEQIILEAGKAEAAGADVLVTPLLSITSLSCGDLFLQQTLQNAAVAALAKIAQETATLSLVLLVGLPIKTGEELYNCVVALKKGQILNIFPKAITPDNSFSNEANCFASSCKQALVCNLFGKEHTVSSSQHSLDIKGSIVAVKFYGDQFHEQTALERCDVAINFSSQPEYAGRAEVLKEAALGVCAKAGCGLVLISPGCGESTTDFVFAGRNIVFEGIDILAQSTPYKADNMVLAKLDIEISSKVNTDNVQKVPKNENELANPSPFLPTKENEKTYCESVLDIQAQGLIKRMLHTSAKKLILGVSGGLDSALALLVCRRALKILGRPTSDVAAFSMPCFGTTKNSKSNAEKISLAAGAAFEEINITASILQHFKDIGHNINDHSVVFENAQARMRTLILMNKANALGGFVVGTGDLSELALGWATFNGDHMSMYGVNAGVPKTLVRYLVSYVARQEGAKLGDVLSAIATAPISPELLPNKDGHYAQLTEENVGPYKLSDFFLYHLLKYKQTPTKIFTLAKDAFAGEYEAGEIKKWMHIFYRRFFSQQFKRNTMPDGPAVFSIGLSPRSGGFTMPSDSSSALWIKEIDAL